jgi:hypothetical protein
VTGDRPGAVEWATFALICGSVVLSATLELMFLSQWYIGTVLVPFVILAAIAGNLALPYWGFSIIGSAKGAIVPVGLWLLVIVFPTLYMRPEGDIFVLGNHGQNYGFYGLFFTGSIAGFATVVVLTTRR